MVSKTVGKRTGGIDAVGDVGALGGFVGSVEVGFIRHLSRQSQNNHTSAYDRSTERDELFRIR